MVVCSIKNGKDAETKDVYDATIYDGIKQRGAK